MAYQEMKCKNCGSLLRFKEQEESLCIFCHAPNTYEEAKEATETENFIFPHTVYAEPSEEEKNKAYALYNSKMSLSSTPRKTTSSQPTLSQNKASEQTKENKTLVPTKDLNVSINKKLLLATFSACFLCLLLFFALVLPMAEKRNTDRTKLLANLKELQFQGISEEKNYSFQSLDNKEFWVLVEEKPTESSAQKAYEQYTQAWQETHLGSLQNHFTENIALTLLHPEGSLFVSFDAPTNKILVKTPTQTKE